MGITVHHQPANTTLLWSIHVWQSAWDGNNVWDSKGTPTATGVDFQLPDAPDPRKLQFKFHCTAPATGLDTWEPDDFIRRLFRISPVEVWTFESSPRILYQNPTPAAVTFNPGDVLTFQVITQNAFRGGQIYVWNPYDPTTLPAYFPQTARDDTNAISTFRVTLLPWMTTGFNLKLMQPATNNQPATWEPDASNRVWRPCDGASLWLKSGQCDVRSRPLTLTPVALQVMYGASLANPPLLTLNDLVEGSTFPLASASTQPYPANNFFNVATYSVPIYPDASYAVITQQNLENPAIQRPFPADPTALGTVSRFALGASAWLAAFPAITPTPLSIKPQQSSSFANGLSVQVSIGNGPSYQTVAATLQSDGIWQATPALPQDTTTAIDLIPTAGTEPKPYAWIDTSRYFTPTAAMPTLYTTEGVYGVCARGPTQFGDPPSRAALMQAAFGAAVVSTGIFAAREMPHGATILCSQIYFVVHAPHAVCVTLILIDETSPGGPSRQQFPMSLTNDTFYWWCTLPVAQAAPGARYRFLLNDDVEVIDPAARSVQDGGSLKTAFNDSPTDPTTSWSIVLDVAAVSAAAHIQPWQTTGWQNFLIYEIHARRFTNQMIGALTSFDLLSDELNATSRLGQPGYLRQLPVTIFGLMPVTEFSSAVSWGYDPSFYFAIDSFYGGALAMANFVNAAHVNGRGVTLDVVYNHSLGSSLMSIAPDVYRNGDYDGDRMNCGHPMVGEYFRQASIYLFRTFNLDGFRFDDTQTIVTKCEGGWEFLAMIRSSLRAAASAEGRAWPYCVAENSATNPWDVSNPSWGVMDGQWGIDEAYRIRSASYDSANPGWDDSIPLKTEMDNPQYWGRPFFQATRFGESHDMVSGQDPLSLRIASRPPFGQGYQLAKALGTLTLLSNGIPMLFMGQEVGETTAFSFTDNEEYINPQLDDLPPATATDNSRILAWFRQLMGLRNDPSKGLQGDANYQVVATGNRTVAFVCGSNQRIFAVVTFGTPNQQQDSSWLGLPGSATYKEIFNSSWPDFQVEFEPEQTNGGYTAQISSGQILNLPWMGAVVLERN
ncbi:MAG TPA: alpha-amylase family glycosyl hydrolase [Terriglobales bacterium]|jgi:1,4-alpha-glucan branching enzyme|nr:alpha-amylase family glycosyl hydrolase [Terriglobales bacterium]